ncbi:MAG: MFS transporter [Micrococcales bacterium]|nr:MFS transporter [Micrococcales bacterium]
MTDEPNSPAGPTSPHRELVGPALALLGVALIALNLRPGASSVGPLLQEIRGGLGMSGTVAGVITALPGLCFGLIGAVAVRLARRVGMSAGIALGTLAVVVGLLARSLVDSAGAFIGLTALALAGMALGNVLVPAWIKRHTGRPVMVMTVYSTGLTVGGSLGALLAAPLAVRLTDGWRSSLAVWGLVALVAVVPWALITLRERRDPGDHATPIEAPSGRLSSSPTAVALTALFGIQSMNAYVQFGWLPQVLRDAGISTVQSGVLLSFIAALGIIGGLVMPSVIARHHDISPVMWAFGALLIAGYLGILLAPAAAPWLWCLCLGVSGFAFPTAIALIAARTRHPAVTAQLSGFVQPIGYLLAAMGPFAVGILHDLTGGWTLILVLLMVSGLLMTAAGLRCARHSFVDDEIS